MVHANRTDSRAENPPRVGFVVSKAVGGAVVRNRVKRQLRAASRPLVAELPTGDGSALPAAAVPGPLGVARLPRSKILRAGAGAWLYDVTPRPRIARTTIIGT